MMPFYAGLDWAKENHAVCVVDEKGKMQTQFLIAHTAEGMLELVRKLSRFALEQPLSIALERSSGLLVDTLLAGGVLVVPIHPNVVKATRVRYAAAPGKSDPGDAYLLADLLRTDGHRFRTLQPLSDQTRALRALVRTRDDLIAQRVALANQLRALLESFWPGAASLFAAVDSPICLAFLSRYPTAESAERLGEKRLAAFLTRNHYTGRRHPRELLQRLHAAPTGRAGELEKEAKAELVRALVAVLKTLQVQLRHLDAAIEHALSTHTAAAVFTSLPRVGRINAAQILAETTEDPSRFQSDDHLAADAGVCPVTYASGKHRGVAFRCACNKRLRKALTTFADNSRHASRWAAAVYASARSRGHDHPHATRILARAWLRVLWKCWNNATPYDEKLHTAAARLAA